jgi:hypothetical protein
MTVTVPVSRFAATAIESSAEKTTAEPWLGVGRTLTGPPPLLLLPPLVPPLLLVPPLPPVLPLPLPVLPPSLPPLLLLPLVLPPLLAAPLLLLPLPYVPGAPGSEPESAQPGKPARPNTAIVANAQKDAVVVRFMRKFSLLGITRARDRGPGLVLASE